MPKVRYSYATFAIQVVIGQPTCVLFIKMMQFMLPFLILTPVLADQSSLGT